MPVLTCISLACKMKPPMGVGAPKGLPMVTFRVSPWRTWDVDVKIAYGGTDVWAGMLLCLGIWSWHAWKIKQFDFWYQNSNLHLDFWYQNSNFWKYWWRNFRKRMASVEAHSKAILSCSHDVHNALVGFTSSFSAKFRKVISEHKTIEVLCRLANEWLRF